jgi:hypothetical protein
MGSPTLESSKKLRILFFETSREGRRACGVSLGSERKARKLLVGGGSCYEAETQIVRFGNPCAKRSGARGGCQIRPEIKNGPLSLTRAHERPMAIG